MNAVMQAVQDEAVPLTLTPVHMVQQQLRMHTYVLAAAALQHCQLLPGLASPQQQLQDLLHLLARAPPGAEAAALKVLEALTSQRLLAVLLQVGSEMSSCCHHAAAVPAASSDINCWWCRMLLNSCRHLLSRAACGPRQPLMQSPLQLYPVQAPQPQCSSGSQPWHVRIRRAQTLCAAACCSRTQVFWNSPMRS